MTSTTSPVDLTNQKEVERILSCSPVVTSYHAGWKGITFTHYHHPPHKTIEHALLQHSLVITNPTSDCSVERRLDGKLQYCAHDKGQVDVIPALLNHQTSWRQDVEFSVIAICPALLNRTVQEPTQRDVELIPQVSIDDPVIRQLAIALKTELKTGCLSGRLYGESLGTAIAARLVRNYATRKPALKAYGLSQRQIARVIDYMKVNLAKDLSISDLATLVGMSESYFSRSFKQSVGVAPYRYLIQQRVERAKKLLKQQNVPISQIALKCGFANQTHLTKVFRQTTGTTPKAYRRR